MAETSQAPSTGDWLVVGAVLLALVLGIIFAAFRLSEEESEARGRLGREAPVAPAQAPSEKLPPLGPVGKP